MVEKAEDPEKKELRERVELLEKRLGIRHDKRSEAEKQEARRYARKRHS